MTVEVAKRKNRRHGVAVAAVLMAVVLAGIGWWWWAAARVQDGGAANPDRGGQPSAVVSDSPIESSDVAAKKDGGDPSTTDSEGLPQDPETRSSVDPEPMVKQSGSPEIEKEAMAEQPGSSGLQEEKPPPDPKPRTSPKTSPPKKSQAVQSAPPTREPERRRAFTIPKIRRKVDPVLTAEAAQACVGEQILMTVMVEENGTVGSLRVHESGNSHCTEAAKAAALAYEFHPAADFEGRPVKASTTISINFDGIHQ